MKKLLLLFCIALLAVSSPASAQTTPDVDPRIRIHYTETQVNEMLSNAPLKIEVLNVYYRSSFVLIPPVHNPNDTSVNASSVDITPYEHLRKENERVQVGYSRTGFVIELLSKRELQALYDQVTN